ncbi:hypothetical protein DN614_31490 [Klebsiella michiganensis]|uniref:hypothetical protein n=1 Tax=Klebsiella michiganensis TaxID=1134687 RepID=UPI000FEB6310|nr:hypothetical protein [Klebsiella michiganensis]RWS76800.1 hypothetical protein DN614_31490 [Klebsiella michiganensis]
MQLDLFRQKGGMGLSEREAVEVARLRWHAFRRAFVGPPCPEFIRGARPACRVIPAAPPVVFIPEPEIEPELETLPEPSLEPEGEEYDDFDMLDATPLDTSQILASARYQMEAERLQRLGCYRRACTRYRKALMLSLPGKRADRLRVMVNRCARMAGKRVRG